MNVGKRITELREQANISTNRLANLCGLSQSFIRSVELGEKGITVENLSLICDALHIQLRDFFDKPDIGDDEELNVLQQQISRLTIRQQKALAAFLETI